MNPQKMVLTEKAGCKRIHTCWDLPQDPSAGWLMFSHGFLSGFCDSSSCAFCLQKFYRMRTNRMWEGEEILRKHTCAPGCLLTSLPVSLGLALLLEVTARKDLLLHLARLCVVTVLTSLKPGLSDNAPSGFPSTSSQTLCAKAIFESTCSECAICLLLDPDE